MHSRNILLLLVSMACLRASASEFVLLGTLGEEQSSEAKDVSWDGQTVVGNASVPPYSLFHAFRWRRGTGMQDLGTLSPDGRSWANAVSADGGVVVGACNGNGPVAFIWDEKNGMRVPFFSRQSEAVEVTADGRAVFGWAVYGWETYPHETNSEIFRWTQELGVQYLSRYPLGAKPTAASANGDVITAYHRGSNHFEYHAFLLSTSSPFENLGGLYGDDSIPLGISADGSTVVGSEHPVNGGPPWYWTRSTGFHLLPTPWGWGLPRAASRDGSIVVGEMEREGSDRERVAVRWRIDGLPSYEILQDTYAARIPAGWTLRSATSISPDGRFIVGNATDRAGYVQAWLLDTAP